MVRRELSTSALIAVIAGVLVLGREAQLPSAAPEPDLLGVVGEIEIEPLACNRPMQRCSSTASLGRGQPAQTVW